MSAKDDLTKALKEEHVDIDKYEGAIFAIQQILHNQTKAIEVLEKNIKSLEQSHKSLETAVNNVPKSIDTSYSMALNTICTTMKSNVKELDTSVKDAVDKLSKSCSSVEKHEGKIKSLQDDLQKLSVKMNDSIYIINKDRNTYLLFIVLFMLWLGLIRYTDWNEKYACILGAIYSIYLAYYFLKN